MSGRRGSMSAQKAAEACDEHAQGFWLKVEPAITKLLTRDSAARRDAAPDRALDKKTRRGLARSW
jgi:hypothetical protein